MDSRGTDRNTGGAGHIPGQTDTHPGAALLCLGPEKEAGVKVQTGGVQHQEHDQGERLSY